MRGNWLFGEELADLGKALNSNLTQAANPVGQGPSCFPTEHDAELGDGNVVAVDGIVVSLVAAGRRLQLRDDLMTEEVEFEPVRGAAAFGTARGPSIKSTCSVEVVNRDGNRKGRQRHGCLLAPIIRCRGGVLAAIERLIIAAYIGTAKGIAVGSVGSEGGIVAGSVVKFAVAFWMVTETAVGIACTIFRAGAEPFVVGPFDQWRSGGVSRGPSNIVGMLSTAGNKKTGNRDKQKSNTREFHRVLTICSRPTILGAFE